MYTVSYTHLIKSSRKLYAILSVYFVYMGVDAVSAFAQYLLGYNVGLEGRAGGVINGLSLIHI